MAEREAINVFDGMREGFRTCQQGGDMRALHALLTAHVLSSDLGMPFSSALRTLRAAFNEIDDWERRR